MVKILLYFLIGFTFSPKDNVLKTAKSFAEAKKVAADESKKILMVFAGSDWCKPCIRFKEQVLVSNEFIEAVGNDIVLLYLDFPARKKNKLSEHQARHNDALAKRFNPKGYFPNILLLNSHEKVISNPSFKTQSVIEFISDLKISN
jgi:thioredoxin-related protein